MWSRVQSCEERVEQRVLHQPRSTTDVVRGQLPPLHRLEDQEEVCVSGCVVPGFTSVTVQCVYTVEFLLVTYRVLLRAGRLLTIQPLLQRVREVRHLCLLVVHQPLDPLRSLRLRRLQEGPPTLVLVLDVHREVVRRQEVDCFETVETRL